MPPMVALEMPGVDRENINVNLESGVLTIEGEINFAKCEGLYPVYEVRRSVPRYTEYNVGNYARSFELSSDVDRGRISAELKDGVVVLTLPKAEKAKPLKIKVN